MYSNHKFLLILSHPMKNKIDMFFTLILDTFLLKKNLKCILIYLLLEATSHLTMQLHRNSKNSLTQFRIYQCHKKKFSNSLILDLY